MGFQLLALQVVKPANIHPGVYCVHVFRKRQVYVGMMNIGTCPTIATNQLQSIEVHLIDFEEDIYGEVIEVQTAFFTRAEQQFTSLDLLVQQLHKDLAQVKSALAIMNEEAM